MTIRLRWVAALLVAVSACSAHVSTGKRLTSAERTYTATWARDVAAVNDAADGMRACDFTLEQSTANDCVLADARMLGALEPLLRDLSAADVPPRYRAGDEAMKRALAETIAALQLRDSSIRAHDSAGVRRSLDDLSSVDLQGAVSLYPSNSGISYTDS